MIDEFWIVNTAGICLFHRIKDDDPNQSQKKDFEQLFSAVFSGIQLMSKEVMNSSLQKIEIGGYKFLFFSEKDLIFIVKAAIKLSDNQIKKRIDILQKSFIKKFSIELHDFDGEITSFKKFEKDLDEIFNNMAKSEKWGSGLLNL